MNLDDYTNKVKEIYEEISAANIKSGSYFNLNSYNNEGTLPHFHFKTKNGKEGCIRLDMPKYFCHETYHDGLNSHEKKYLLKILSEEKWKKLVDEWNEGRKENLVTCKMPDYNLLPILNPTTGKLNKEDRK